MVKTPKMLSVQDAATRLGITPKGVTYHCRKGTLKGARVDTYRGPQPFKWVVEEASVEAFLARGRRSELWNEADVEALLELARSQSCTDAQIAAYLGTSEARVTDKLKTLRRQGARLPNRRGQRFNPFEVPASSILLAKTCPTCGKLRDASCFCRPPSLNGNYFHMCKVCQADKQRARGQDKPTDRTQERALQAITLPLATRKSQQYTSADLELISDMSKSDFEVAIESGRTLYAIKNTRGQNGFRGPKYTKAHWVIQFPNALKALQKHFRELGQAVPEELWEWNDEEMAS